MSKRGKGYIFSSNDKQSGQWAKQIGRDGYATFTEPIVRKTFPQALICCDRIVRYYTNDPYNINSDVKDIGSARNLGSS